MHGQIINFPDANFKAKLLQSDVTNNIAYDVNEQFMKIDTNLDGEIQLSEAQNVYGINVDNSGISDLTGISNFPNLKSLNCSYNSLTNITIDNSINIWQLFASHNLISSINVNFLSYVEGIDLSYNNFTSFELGDVLVWETLNLSHNQLSNLTFNSTRIEYLNLGYNNLNQINFVGNVWFYRDVNLTNNQFTLLDLTSAIFANDSSITLGNNPEDRVLFGNYQANNVFYSSSNTQFDLGNFYMTKTCEAEFTGNVVITNSPNLQNIIFKNGYTHGYITCNEGGTIFQNPALYLGIENCPSLTHICVDQGDEQTMIQARINQLGLQNQVVVDSNCESSVLQTVAFSVNEAFVISPVPVQNTLQITSINNLVIDSIEIYNLLGQKVQITIGNNQSIDVSNLSKGNYFLKINTGESTFTNRFIKE
jgi:hypothetical protein